MFIACLEITTGFINAHSLHHESIRATTNISGNVHCHFRMWRLVYEHRPLAHRSAAA
jgi:hypothetical protein